MAEVAKPRVIGFNHVAPEVGDIDEALNVLRPTLQIRTAWQD
jgi:hypothetical protein